MMAAHTQFADARALCSGVDSHAHVIRRGYRMVNDRRYTPDYDATVEE